MSKYSIVVPCYKSDKTIAKLVKMTAAELERLGKTDYEFVLVNDCSPDGGKTMKELRALAEELDYVIAIDLAKNTGQHNAIMAALNHASGDYIVAMDDDMQTHPSQLQYLFAELDKGYDVVYGYYEQKKHSLFRNLGSKFNYWTARLLIGKPKGLKTSSYWVMRRFVRDSIIEYKSSYSYLQGLILRTTRNIGTIQIQHYEREVGESGYTFKALLKLWSSIIGFSIVPLRIATYSGYFFSAVGIIGALVVVIRKLLNPSMAMGWPSTMCAICFFFGLNFLFMGLIGEYIGRKFLGMNKQPQYIVKEIINYKDERN